MKRKLLTFCALISGIMAHAQTGLDQTAAQIVAKMGAGWNLGNTFEACNAQHLYTNNGGLGCETYWQDTRTTQEIIDFVKAQGFNSIRIPCSWVCGHITNAETYEIDQKWLARVKEVVDYCINDGLYVVLNQHWDGGWLENNINATGAAKTKNMAVLEAIWKQIATYFRDYDEHLLFAGLNEPNADNQTTTNQLLEYEQVFINTVRATGGNNERRVLVIQGPSTNIEHTCNYVKSMPNDPTATDRLAIEVHYYDPWQFWGMEKDENWGNMFFYWGKDNHQPGSKHNPNWDCEESHMEAQFKLMKDNFVDKGYPVIIGEYGANWRNISGLAGESQEKHNASINLHYYMITKLALENGMCPMAWDTNYRGPSMTIINRKSLKIYNAYIMDAIKEAISVTPVLTPLANPAPSTGRAYDLQGHQIQNEEAFHGIMIKDHKKVVR